MVKMGEVNINLNILECKSMWTNSDFYKSHYINLNILECK